MSQIRVIPLGGADEVGASCTLLEMGNTRIVVDVGIRMGGQAGDHLPDLGRIQDGGPLSAIILTHAHLDHTGALPLLHLNFPNVPIFSTPPTSALISILLFDALKIMEHRSNAEGEIPLYPREAVESCLGKMNVVAFDTPLTIDDKFVLTFFPAGHILGAASLGIQTEAGSLMVTGDFSVTNQLTIPGMLAPRFSPDLVITESTYGNRMHSNRKNQERALIERVNTAVENGGKVLIPAFALGRAQEVILILKNAMERKLVKPFPVHVDGMVRSVCRAYSSFPDCLNPRLRKAVQRSENPFFPRGKTIKEVKSPPDRQKILEGPPCCIIASSGMLTGGASTFYAAELAKSAENLITITGYQDEEAPGRRLLDLLEAPAGARFLKLGDKQIEVKCGVGKYALSAHADSGELTGLMTRLSPSDGAILVHGDGGARAALARSFETVLESEVFLPANGEELLFNLKKKSKHRVIKFDSPQTTGKQALTKEDLAKLHHKLWMQKGTRALYRVLDLYRAWFGYGAIPKPEELTELTELIIASGLFDADFKRPHMYRVSNPDAVEAEKASSAALDPAKGGKIEVNQALALISQTFDNTTGLYKKGALIDQGILRLAFNFPAVAEVAYKDRFKEIEKSTGWKLELNQVPHQGALAERARELLSESFTVVKNPSIRNDIKEVTVKISGDSDPSVDQKIKETFFSETRYKLKIVHHVGTPQTKSKILAQGQLMEINSAYREIDSVFADLPHKPNKKGLTGDHILLRFVTPEIGKRYLKPIAELTKIIGREIEIHPHADQNTIKNTIKLLIPAEWGLLKEPSFHGVELKVGLKLANPPDEKEWKNFAAKVHEMMAVTVSI